jgi:hypothetical protein
VGQDVGLSEPGDNTTDIGLHERSPSKDFWDGRRRCLRQHNDGGSKTLRPLDVFCLTAATAGSMREQLWFGAALLQQQDDRSVEYRTCARLSRRPHPVVDIGGLQLHDR